MVLSLSTSGSSTATENRQRKGNPSYSFRCLSLSPAMRQNAGMAKRIEVSRLARKRKSTSSFRSLVGWLVGRVESSLTPPCDRVFVNIIQVEQWICVAQSCYESLSRRRDFDYIRVCQYTHLKM